MVGWYDPSQLLDTATKTVISTIIGENADPRLVTAAASHGKFFDYSTELKITKTGEFEESKVKRNEIWIDYVADVGDGWNSTYSVAYTLAQKTLEISGKVLQRGELLIFGGDEVYPTPTDEIYKEKLIEPYQLAFNSSRNVGDEKGTADNVDLKKHPHVFAIPGNHDWYDSLVSFQKIFCTDVFNNRLFADAWQTRQKRGYFALKLPHKWWLLGIDYQLSHSIDVRQLEYFQSVANQMEAGDKVILCVPEPYWVNLKKYNGVTDIFEKKDESIRVFEKYLNDKYLENPIEVRVYVAGDLHHYRRFESTEGMQKHKITAGGGGAFMHPTHDFDFKSHETPGTQFALKTNYPRVEISNKLDWKNLYGFIWCNKTFGIFTAIFYSLLALLLRGDLKEQFTWKNAFEATVRRFIEEPLAFLMVVAILLGLVFFTDSNSTWYRRVAGTIHGFAHLVAIFVLGWLGYRLSNQSTTTLLWIFSIAVVSILVVYLFFSLRTFKDGKDFLRWLKDYKSSIPWLIGNIGIVCVLGFLGYLFGGFSDENITKLIWIACIVLVCGVGGHLIGSLIMGVYLFVSLHIFGRHANEAFSAMKIEDYKNFLRLHINAIGNLTIYPIKIEKVGKTEDWIPKNVDGNEFYVPKNKLEAELIEEIKPIY